MTESKKILFEGWYSIPHSYGIVTAFLLIHLYKNYGPNGKIKKDAINLYIKEMPFYNQNWNKIKGKFVYTKEYNEILKGLKETNNETVDLIYRQTFPYNVDKNPKNIPKCIFYTSEFGMLNPAYFSNFNNDIKTHIEESNIYLTNPSYWSSKGMLQYIEHDEKGTIRDRIISHGVDTSIFYKTNNIEKRNEIRTKYNINDTDILMINIGSMTGNKGMLLMIKALNELVNRRNERNFKLMLKGSGDLYQSKNFLNCYFDVLLKNNEITQDELDNLLNNNYIIFTEKTLSYPVINDLFNACDLYISPYLAEGFNLTVLEALSSGLNVLVPKLSLIHI